jgi:regulator of sirC expression with transglutaminase-like and TPR domain
MPGRKSHPFLKLTQQKDEEINLAEGALLIAKDAYPELEIEDYLGQLKQMGAELQKQIDPESDVKARIDALNAYLFDEQGFSGADEEHYYDVRNSYLNDVLERKVGIPITLSVVYMQIGRQIGLPLVGVNFPGHFIVKHKVLDTFIDPFEKGKILTNEDFPEKLIQLFGKPVPMQSQFLKEAANKQILARMLRNLKQIYFRQGQYEKAVSAVEKITWLEPQSAQDFRDLGYLYYRLQAYPQSLAAFQQYLRLSDNLPDQEEIARNIRVIIEQIASLN